MRQGIGPESAHKDLNGNVVLWRWSMQTSGAADLIRHEFTRQVMEQACYAIEAPMGLGGILRSEYCFLTHNQLERAMTAAIRDYFWLKDRDDDELDEMESMDEVYFDQSALWQLRLPPQVAEDNVRFGRNQALVNLGGL